MAKTLRGVKGTRDLLPPETAVWAAVERCARRVFGLYGYDEIRTPVLEPTELFVRGVGEATDIVGKEMYTFEDRKGRNLALRPESTAAVVRSFLQHRLEHGSLPARLFYVGPHFRYERPQKGRYRQFHQIGAELVGDPGPHSDAEMIAMLMRFLGALGLEGLEVQLNTVGDRESRAAYRAALVAYLTPLAERLGEESRRRLETNPLRILDTKNPGERELLTGAPRLEDHLNTASREHFDDLRTLLTDLGIPHRVEPHLVRGLDYYSRTVFEIVAHGLGAQDAIVGGGRYDGLVAELGGPDLPAIGFAIGQDRLIESLGEDFRAGVEPTPPVLVLPMAPVSPRRGLRVAAELRDAGIAATVELGGTAIKTALKRADRAGVRYVALLGEDELAAGGVALKDLKRGEQSFVAHADLARRLEEMG